MIVLDSIKIFQIVTHMFMNVSRRINSYLGGRQQLVKTIGISRATLKDIRKTLTFSFMMCIYSSIIL